MQLIIRRLTIPHCARGPARCERCAAARPALALLDVDPPGETARPIIEVVRDGTPFFFPFDVVRRFEDAEEARDFARAHGVVDIDLGEDDPPTDQTPDT